MIKNINYADIYYYLYYYNKTNGKSGKYSNHFYEIYKNCGSIIQKKKQFKKKIKNYNIGKDRKLYKYVNVIDNLSYKSIIKNLQIVPQKALNKILLFYHELTDHRNYHILTDKIKNDGFYWNTLTEDCKDYIKVCVSCTTKNRTNILPPPSNQILCSKPKELYLVDITYISHEFLLIILLIIKKKIQFYQK